MDHEDDDLMAVSEKTLGRNSFLSLSRSLHWVSSFWGEGLVLSSSCIDVVFVVVSFL